jgi:hypothetical protein
MRHQFRGLLHPLPTISGCSWMAAFRPQKTFRSRGCAKRSQVDTVPSSIAGTDTGNPTVKPNIGDTMTMSKHEIEHALTELRLSGSAATFSARSMSHFVFQTYMWLGIKYSSRKPIGDVQRHTSLQDQTGSARQGMSGRWRGDAAQVETAIAGFHPQRVMPT